MNFNIKQMLRTPVRTTLFFFLLILATLLMVLGGNLWLTNYKKASVYENQFMTIGTVNQKATSMSQEIIWDAEKKDYWIKRQNQYDTYLSPSDLVSPETKYIERPEKRSYYGSYTPEYTHLWEAENPVNSAEGSVVAEFSPVKDSRPDESIQIMITKVFGNYKSLENTIVWFCDHTNPTPEILYADKTYVGMLYESLNAHGKEYEKIPSITGAPMEYRAGSISATLFDESGARVADTIQVEKNYYEVSDGFYDTKIGKRYLSLADQAALLYKTQPVTGTNKTELLIPFYYGDAYVCEGRNISQEEYDNGSKVCLAPASFMKNNHLTLNDKITVRLYYTNSSNTASSNFEPDGSGPGYNFLLINTHGKLLEPFETNEYRVVGIYNVTVSPTESRYNLGADELIVPLKSIQNRKKNIIAYGAMKDTTTTFQISNGSISSFLVDYSKHGSDEVEFSFHDKGYSSLKSGIENMKSISLLLLLIGFSMIVLLLLLFTHIFITKQKERIAIERSMGMSRGECRRSMLSGIVIVLLLGSILGALAGGGLSNMVSAKNVEREYYDNSYSAISDRDVVEDPVFQLPDYLSLLITLGSIVLTAAMGMGISFLKLQKSLDGEPITLFFDASRQI